MPISADFGLSGRAFVDVGGLSETTAVGAFRCSATGVVRCSRRERRRHDNGSPRVGAGVGVSWKTPFGLINIDLAQAVVKKKYDQTQFFRFGFGTRF